MAQPSHITPTQRRIDRNNRLRSAMLTALLFFGILVWCSFLAIDQNKVKDSTVEVGFVSVGLAALGEVEEAGSSPQNPETNIQEEAETSVSDPEPQSSELKEEVETQSENLTNVSTEETSKEKPDPKKNDMFDAITVGGQKASDGNNDGNGTNEGPGDQGTHQDDNGLSAFDANGMNGYLEGGQMLDEPDMKGTATAEGELTFLFCVNSAGQVIEDSFVKTSDSDFPNTLTQNRKEHIELAKNAMLKARFTSDQERLRRCGQVTFNYTFFDQN